MSELLDYARHELARLRGGSEEPDEMQAAIEANVLAVVGVFASGGHSGSSAAYALGIIEKVLRFEPVSPLTGEDDEWGWVGNDKDMCWQNKRYPHVFKRADGTAWDGQGLAYRDPDGTVCMGPYSRRDVKFPYTPKTEVVERPVDGDSVCDKAVAKKDYRTPFVLRTAGGLDGRGTVVECFGQVVPQVVTASVENTVAVESGATVKRSRVVLDLFGETEVVRQIDPALGTQTNVKGT